MKHNAFTLGLLAAHPQNAARTLESFSPEELAQFLTEIPATVSAGVVRELSPALAAACLSYSNPEKVSDIVQNLDTDMAGMILRRLDKSKRHEVVNHLPASNWIGLRMVLRYPADTVGSVMDPNVLSVHKEMPVANIIKNMKLFKNQLLHAVYITDRSHTFAGALDVRDLFFANERQLAGELMHKVDNIVTARSTLHSTYHDDIWAGQSELPVVDHNRRFLGVLHQSSLNKALEHLVHHGNNENALAETALALSELIWNACAGIFSGAVDSRTAVERRKREKSDEQ